MPDNENRHKVTVETLLQLKRSERPNPEFWNNFDRDFDRRRLHELVNRPSIHDILFRPLLRLLAVGMPAAAVIMLTLFWKSSSEPIPEPLVLNNNVTGSEAANEPVLFPETETLPEPVFESAIVSNQQVANQFVLDALQEQNQTSLQFRKILYTPAIRLSVPSGAFYVHDSMSSNAYRVTTADAKLGRNF